VKDHVAAIHQLRRHRYIHDGVDGVVKIGIPFQMKDIVDFTGGKVIDDKDLMALLQKIFRKVRTDESSAACNESFHKSEVRSQKRCKPFQ